MVHCCTSWDEGTVMGLFNGLETGTSSDGSMEWLEIPVAQLTNCQVSGPVWTEVGVGNGRFSGLGPQMLTTAVLGFR